MLLGATLNPTTVAFTFFPGTYPKTKQGFLLVLENK